MVFKIGKNVSIVHAIEHSLLRSYEDYCCSAHDMYVCSNTAANCFCCYMLHK